MSAQQKNQEQRSNKRTENLRFLASLVKEGGLKGQEIWAGKLRQMYFQARNNNNPLHHEWNYINRECSHVLKKLAEEGVVKFKEYKVDKYSISKTNYIIQ